MGGTPELHRHRVMLADAAGSDDSIRRGNVLVIEQSLSQTRTFFDELRNGTRGYRTVASLGEQIAQEYRGRCLLELLQNAHDALAKAGPGDPRRISFVLTTSPEPVLLIGNSGAPFCVEDFKGICQLGQSPKNPDESVGNKGLGFRSVLEVSSCPEIWSTPPAGSDISFVFRFARDAAGLAASAAREIEARGLEARFPLDREQRLLDWSEAQLNRYLERLSNEKFDAAKEAKALSPYQLPLPMETPRPEVQELIEGGHVTVIRLPLDGGRTGTSADAIQSIREQLEALNARSAIFLSHLAALTIEVDGERRNLKRTAEPDAVLSSCSQSRQQRVLVTSSGPSTGEEVRHRFRFWTRSFGGDDEPEQAAEIRAAVAHLPNRWPEVRRVEVGLAVEEGPAADNGVFVIFLPTEVTTGTGAHINAPFYGSLDRRHINFEDSYNQLLLNIVLDLCLDAVMAMVRQPPEDWRARAVIDILSSTAKVGGKDWRLMDRLLERAEGQGEPLANLPMILCDEGWCIAGEARLMPALPDSLIDAGQWRAHARFHAASTGLDSRRDAVKELVTVLEGSVNPSDREWSLTIAQIASQVRDRKIDVDWDGFLRSLVSVLPANLKAAQGGAGDPLASVKFLPAQDGRLLSASDPARLFFQPVRGADDAAEFAENVPKSLEQRVAFLHPVVQTHQQDGQRRFNTEVQKFLDERFVRGFRREELLKEAVLPALPELPVPHDSPEADICAELFSWSLRLIGEEELDSLLASIKHLPVACHGGWFAMRDAVFGPGWDGHGGELLWQLTEELPDDLAVVMRSRALLSPDDSRWPTSVKEREALFSRAGIVDGLRLLDVPDIRFCMEGRGRHQLPATPGDVPGAAWGNWCKAVNSDAKPYYEGSFEYTLSGIRSLPGIQHLPDLSRSARDAFWRLVLASFKHWSAKWDSVVLTKNSGSPWRTRLDSPLKYWLETLPWLADVEKAGRPLSERWLILESHLSDQPRRFAHLNPLSKELVRQLADKPELKNELQRLGLNTYPTEEDRTGPELLNALAAAWAARKVPPQRFDVFLGQLRHAWRQFDPQDELPERFLVKSNKRSFSVYGRDELRGVYLPDSKDRSQSLREYDKPTLEMDTADARRVAKVLLAATELRPASMLKEHVIIDNREWSGTEDDVPPLDETRYSWLPIILLTIAAYGGNRPTGTDTDRWQRASDRLRQIHLLECASITVQLTDEGEVLAESEPRAHLLPNNILAIRRDMGPTFEDLAPAAQAILDRQDLLNELKLALNALDYHQEPSPERIDAAIRRAGIDDQPIAEVRGRWAGSISDLVDRIRPVLALLGVAGDGLDAATTERELTEWVSANLPQWPAEEMLSAAKRSRNDRAMGEAAWRALGEVAQLPAWNRALETLGQRYATVNNRTMKAEANMHVEDVKPWLRALARHVALSANDPELFHKMETVHQSWQAPKDWESLWWEVPFAAVIGSIREAYGGISVARHYLQVLEGAESIAALRTAFSKLKIELEPDPYETARSNKRALEEMLPRVHDLYQVWVELRASSPAVPGSPGVPDEHHAGSYLYRWPEGKLLEQSLDIIDDAEFRQACEGCATPDDVRERLKLDPGVVEKRRQGRLQLDQAAARQRRTFSVAGAPFEAGLTPYTELFERLNTLDTPKGPHVGVDALTPLDELHPVTSSPGGTNGSYPKSSSRRDSAEVRKLVGIAGEIHAFRFLRSEFGSEIVTRDAWVSEIRLEALPLVPGEPDGTSDGYGFDFRFHHKDVLWHIEVKATRGDDTQFELGISQIEAASRLARQGNQRWRILRVNNALSEQPSCEWLPNPFEDGFTKYFRMRNGGMTMSYARRGS